MIKSRSTPGDMENLTKLGADCYSITGSSMVFLDFVISIITYLTIPITGP